MTGFIGGSVTELWGRVAIFTHFRKQRERRGPLSINAFFNEKTLDYLFDNQAFVGFVPPQYLSTILTKTLTLF
jgi:hypothetical protein